MKLISAAVAITCGAMLFAADDISPRDTRTPIVYNRDIRPILADNCFMCHGPDERARQAGLRLDLREQATQPSALGGIAIVPGKPGESKLIERIHSPHRDSIMPPPESNKKLSPADRELLKRWIEQGAEYQPHWSFIPPERPALPKLTPNSAQWCRNPIDYFILARLEAEKLAPAPEADRTTLIRRVTFDLTGLPPTLAQIDAFLADTSVDAYEKLVDRLLDSPRFGERMAIDWLDAARFADTHGYHIDSARDMTRWRDWVIDSFNQNLPFDQFTVQQLAGDLMPPPELPATAAATTADRDALLEKIRTKRLIATGFNRNHMINFEGGAIPEEYHAAYIVDRVNTTATVWMGLTIGCAQCHDHKYDPISQKEYFQLYAFFHNVPEKGLDGRDGNAAPTIKLPTRSQQEQLDRLSASVRDLEERLTAPSEAFDAAQLAWEAAQSSKPAEWVPLELTEIKSAGGAYFTERDDRSISVTGPNADRDTYSIGVRTPLEEITAIRLEALPDESLNGKGPGRSVNGNIVLTDVRAQRMPATTPTTPPDSTPLKFKRASADFSQKDFPVANAIDDQPASGWAIHPEVGKPHAAVFEFESALRVAKPGGEASPENATAEPITLTISLDFQSQFGQHQLGRFRLTATSAKNPHDSQLPTNIREILAIESNQRNDEQRADLRNYYRNNVSDETKKLKEELARLRKEQSDVEKLIPTSMVMQEMPAPRDTFLLERGQYDKKGEKVTAGVPAAFPALPEGAPANRLGLAQWLVAPSHPLTARVMVNRFWQMYFGTGLVKTAEDFGSQGEWPSHPELLDWLAVEFAHGDVAGRPWDIKHLQRLIVTSATYRQSSVATPELVARDPENRLLARGPRLRLQAEFIRDQALAVAGLLDNEIGGRSVSPYQPPGIWEELAYRQDGKNFTAQEYVQGHGRDLYRRTMYTFVKRTAPPPMLVTFDSPDRETCTVRRPRTNTPLQALILMNDPTFVEASRKFAERIMIEVPGADSEQSTEARLRFAFRLATARHPRPEELRVLREFYGAQRSVYRADREAALRLLAVGESPRNSDLDPAELAAWTMIANAILNLDETLTKG